MVIGTMNRSKIIFRPKLVADNLATGVINDAFTLCNEYRPHGRTEGKKSSSELGAYLELKERCICIGDYNYTSCILKRKFGKQVAVVYSTEAPTRRTMQNVITLKRLKSQIDFAVANDIGLIKRKVVKRNCGISYHFLVGVTVNIESDRDFSRNHKIQ